MRNTMRASVLNRGDYVWASVQGPLSDTEVIELQRSLLAMVAANDSRAVVVDVSALDIIDSFIARSLTTMARSNAMRGAATIVVGIRPEVADAMSRFRLRLDATTTALDTDAAFDRLGRLRHEAAAPRSSADADG